MPNYIVLYTEGCTPKAKQFKSRSSALKFANKHEQKNRGPYGDDWVDCVIRGEIVQTYQSWYGPLIPEKG